MTPFELFNGPLKRLPNDVFILFLESIKDAETLINFALSDIKIYRLIMKLNLKHIDFKIDSKKYSDVSLNELYTKFYCKVIVNANVTHFTKFIETINDKNLKLMDDLYIMNSHKYYYNDILSNVNIRYQVNTDCHPNRAAKIELIEINNLKNNYSLRYFNLVNFDFVENIIISNCDLYYFDPLFSISSRVKRASIISCCLFMIPVVGSIEYLKLEDLPIGAMYLPYMTNLDDLSRLRNVENLEIINCGITSFKQLYNNTIKKLTIDSCRSIETVEGIENIPDLTLINISNATGSVQGYDNLVGVNKLKLYSSWVPENLNCFSDLTELWLENCPVVDLSGLCGFSLKILTLVNLDIEEISIPNLYLEKITIVDCLYFDDLRHLKGIHEVEIYNCNICDVSPLYQAYKLSIINCPYVMNVSYLHQVTYLNLTACTGISDFSMLKAHQLILDDTHVKSINNISSFSISIRNTRITMPQIKHTKAKHLNIAGCSLLYYLHELSHISRLTVCPRLKNLNNMTNLVLDNN